MNDNNAGIIILKGEGQVRPEDIGSLEREQFAHLGDWHIFRGRKADYGLAYRIGMKTGTAPDGAPMYVWIHFNTPLSNRGRELRKNELADIQEILRYAIKNTTDVWARKHPNTRVVSIDCPDPPEYMIKELEDMLE